MAFGYCEPTYPPHTITLCKALRPQGLAQRRVQELSPLSPLPYAPSTSRLQGNIDSLKDCPLASLNLEYCGMLEGMTCGYCEPSYPPRTITLCKVLRPQGNNLGSNVYRASGRFWNLLASTIHKPRRHCQHTISFLIYNNDLHISGDIKDLPKSITALVLDSCEKLKGR